MPAVSFYNADIKLEIKSKRKIKQFIPLLFSSHDTDFQSLTIIFCSDDYLLSLNKQFLQHDYYTDILTFNLSADTRIVGEIYISIDRVIENASRHDATFTNELLRIIFHGVLHLCGFGDKTPAEKKKMTILEDESLLKFGAFHVKQ